MQALQEFFGKEAAGVAAFRADLPSHKDDLAMFRQQVGHDEGVRDDPQAGQVPRRDAGSQGPAHRHHGRSRIEENLVTRFDLERGFHADGGLFPGLLAVGIVEGVQGLVGVDALDASEGTDDASFVLEFRKKAAGGHFGNIQQFGNLAHRELSLGVKSLHEQPFSVLVDFHVGSFPSTV